MKFIRPILIFLPVFFVLSVSAQEAFQTIRGVVLDKESREFVYGAEVTLYGSGDTLKTSSDSMGEFAMEKVRIGRYNMSVYKAGYRLFARTDLVVNSAKQVVITAELEMDAVLMGEVIIQQKGTNPARTNNEMILVSGRQFTTDQTNRYAGSLMDPSRMAANFAGVSGTTGQRNDIVVRGNSPMGLLWRLEGIDIPNPNHFSSQGSTGGPVSILNNNNLANSDFISGAFPAEYGNALSAVFDLKMREGNNRKREYTGQIGFNGFEFGAEGPFAKNKRASYLINYRYSTLGFFDAIGINLTFAGIPYYQDICFKLNLPGSKSGDWTLTGIGGMSHVTLLNSNKDSSDISFGSSVRDNIRNGSSMGAIILSNTVKIRKGYVKTIAAMTHDGRFTQYDTLDKLDKPTTTYGEGSSNKKLILHSFINRRLTNRNVLRAGFILTNYWANIKDSSMNDSGRIRMLRNLQEHNLYGQAYAEIKTQWARRLFTNVGLHSLYLHANSDAVLEPRLAVQYKLSGTQSLSMGVGIHSQLQPLEIYYGQSYNPLNNTYWLTNTQLKFSRARHFVIGYDNQLFRTMRIKTEAYYQKLSRIPVEPGPYSYSVLNLGADFGGLFVVDSLQSKGTGTNYGFEFTIEKFFSKNYYFLVTASLFDSKYTSYSGKTFNTAFNGKYVLNTLAGYEFVLGKKKRHVLGMNVKVTNAGGRRYTPIDEEASRQSTRVQFDWDNAYSKQFKAYFRADFKLSFKINARKVSHEWALDIQNFFDTQNPLTVTFDHSTGKSRYEYQQGRLPMLFYRIQF